MLRVTGGLERYLELVPNDSEAAQIRAFIGRIALVVDLPRQSAATPGLTVV